MAYKYFCGYCGHHFSSELPELNEYSLHNSIACPECGSWDSYPDTEAGAEQSVKDLTDYENSIVGWDEEE